MDIFLNQLTQFYSNNAINLRHLTTHITTCCPTKWSLCCDHRHVTSLHPMYYTQDCTTGFADSTSDAIRQFTACSNTLKRVPRTANCMSSSHYDRPME